MEKSCQIYPQRLSKILTISPSSKVLVRITTISNQNYCNLLTGLCLPLLPYISPSNPFKIKSDHITPQTCEQTLPYTGFPFHPEKKVKFSRKPTKASMIQSCYFFTHLSVFYSAPANSGMNESSTTPASGPLQLLSPLLGHSFPTRPHGCLYLLAPLHKVENLHIPSPSSPSLLILFL